MNPARASYVITLIISMIVELYVSHFKVGSRIFRHRETCLRFSKDDAKGNISPSLLDVSCINYYYLNSSW